MNHSPEPWQPRTTAEDATLILDANRVPVASTLPRSGFGEMLGNRARIMSCVNACEGISDAALDGGVIRDAAAALRSAAQWLGAIAAMGVPAENPKVASGVSELTSFARPDGAPGILHLRELAALLEGKNHA